MIKAVDTDCAEGEEVYDAELYAFQIVEGEDNVIAVFIHEELRDRVLEMMMSDPKCQELLVDV